MQFDYDPLYGFHYDPTFGQSNPNIDQNLFPQPPKKLKDEIQTCEQFSITIPGRIFSK